MPTIHRKLVFLAICAAILACQTASAAPGELKAKDEKVESGEPEAKATEEKDEVLKSAETARIVKQVNHVNEDNSYTVGHEAEDGSFKIETRSADGHVKGTFAFVDAATGALKRFVYSTRPEDAALINPPAMTNLPTPPVAENKKRRQLRYRRPQDSESPDDPSQALTMLLRRSRQGSRTDADELLRLQQQQQQFYQPGVDSGDVYGADGQLRQHLLRGRVQSAVLRHLTPGQLSELHQYVTPEARRALNPSLRALMSPVLDYLSNRDEYYDPYLSYYPGQYQRPAAAYNPYYPSAAAPYEDLRLALIQRMLLAARLLGLDNSLPLGRLSGGGYEGDQYSDRLVGQRFYTQPDPRLSSYNLRSLPYQQALQLARETHERQLAAYQASYATRPTYPEPSATPFVIHTPDPAGVEYEYSTVTPASAVRATSARPSNIQRVRNVQVITAATATPSPSSTTVAPRNRY
ncbi:uncharacterized protein LOC132200616 isoform X1 [Neocloeon triangulifer]|uniref:uncharacterized protein LOC132200616 isoform X1 n=1 Tax=Neocloeon triangulifer TaxID=2078957 RepID=UPI00286F0E13|nr:uncharacterized protein LOC132200616 isoform X1 [Neocloeon triangulifer]